MIRRFFSIFVGAAALVALQMGDEARAQAQRQPKVAVYNFTEPEGKELASQLQEMTRTALINSKKFAVFSRDFSSAEEEAQLRRAGKTTRNASNSSAQFEAIDFAIEGSITSAQLTESKDSTSIVLGGVLGLPKETFVGCTSGVFSVSIDVRVTSLGTGQNSYAESLTKKRTSECRRAGGAVDFPAVMREIANELAFKFSTKIYPMKVIDSQADGAFILNYGDSFVPMGTVLRITTPSQDIISDGATLKRVGTLLGRACVVDANSDTAVARMFGAPPAAVLPVGSVAQIEALPSFDKKTKKPILCKV
jgi:hypothetical protein